MPPNSQPHLKDLSCPSTGLDLALDLFITAKEAERCTVRTVKTYRWTLRQFLDWLKARDVLEVQVITPHHIRQFLAGLDQQGCAASYIHIYARTIKTWVRFLHMEGLLAADPMQKVAMPRLAHEVLPAFTPEEVKRLLSACHTKRDTALVLALLDTGCRAAELVGLNIDDIDLSTGAVTVRLGKGGKSRTTYLGSKATRALHRYLAERPPAGPDAPLFPSATTAERLTTNGLLLLCRRLGQRAGVARCNPHKFRRTFALWSLRAGMNIYALQRLMGHSELTVLQRYLALVEQDLQQAHRKCGAVDCTL